jgi:uncharacterized protein YraI
MTFRTRAFVFASALALTACGSKVQGDSGEDDIEQADGGGADGSEPQLQMGAVMRVTANSLNLRDGVGTGANILVAMPCGASVQVVGGPSTTPVIGWWQVSYMGQTGWASGKYLTPDASFDAATCAMTPPDLPPSSQGVADIFALAKPAVGYSYYWGHGSWRSDGQSPGSCSGSCPSCTHTGQYGADCSGFVAKVWQIPAPSPIEKDLHPYSTYNFVNSEIHWTKVPRSTLQPADSLVYNTNGKGHIVLVESGSDPFGSLWMYEARGCSTGIVHNLRSLASTYSAIRKKGL